MPVKSVSKKATLRGYVLIFKPDHPNAFRNGWMFEHRFVMSEFLKRPLLSSEVCHHKDGNRKNNAVENLQICTNSEHTKIHFPRGKCDICGRPHYARGFCVMHYARWEAKAKAIRCVKCGKKVNKAGRRKKPTQCWRCAFPLNIKCKICGKPQKCRKLCVKHYQRWLRHKWRSS